MKTGVGASPGIGIGKVIIIKEPEMNIVREEIPIDRIPEEVELINRAVKQSKIQLQELMNKSLKNNNQEAANILETHIALIEDSVFIEEIVSMIAKECINASYALKEVVDKQIKIFEAIEDLYLRERARDIEDIGRRLMRNLFNIEPVEIHNIREAVVLVGRDITPAQMALINSTYVKGIVTEVGGITSHTAILAKNMDMPAVLGVKGITTELVEGELIAVDGSKGIIDLHLDDDKIVAYKEKIKEAQDIKKQLEAYKTCVTQTKDGKPIMLGGNIGKPEDIKFVLENGGEGVGLFRTEFLFMDQTSMPSEDIQFEAYKRVVEEMNGKPVIIRTLDIGGDKDIPYLNLPKEENPFLGYRAIRVCFDQLELFKTQLRAILRASAFGNTKIMFPMIASTYEVIQAKRILTNVRKELKEKKISYDAEMEVGVMIEIPSAAITADLIIKEVDFFSIGTNDLTQYSLAADRMNEKVHHIYNSFHPAILRLIKNVIDASHEEGKVTGMCGEFASNPMAVTLLLGLGLDEFSMSPSAIPEIRKLIHSIDLSEARAIAEEVMKLGSSEEIQQYMKEKSREKSRGDRD